MPTDRGFLGEVLDLPRTLAPMDKDESIHACYWHACLKYFQRQPVTNTSIRERFGITTANSATASRLLKEAVQNGCLVPYDPDAARSQMKYLSWWATRGRGS